METSIYQPSPRVFSFFQNGGGHFGTREDPGGEVECSFPEVAILLYSEGDHNLVPRAFPLKNGWGEVDGDHS